MNKFKVGDVVTFKENFKNKLYSDVNGEMSRYLDKEWNKNHKVVYAEKGCRYVKIEGCKWWLDEDDLKLVSTNTSHIDWQTYFMNLAVLSSFRSKDKNTQVGACIVNKENKVVGLGYNGMPYTLISDNDKTYPTERDGSFLDTKYAYVVHAEANAILNSTQSSLKDCTVYVTLFPCNECAKLIVQSRIKKVIYLSDKYNGTDSNTAAKKILSNGGVEFEQYKGNTISRDML